MVFLPPEVQARLAEDIVKKAASNGAKAVGWLVCTPFEDFDIEILPLVFSNGRFCMKLYSKEGVVHIHGDVTQDGSITLKYQVEHGKVTVMQVDDINDEGSA